MKQRPDLISCQVPGYFHMSIKLIVTNDCDLLFKNTSQDRIGLLIFLIPFAVKVRSLVFCY